MLQYFRKSDLKGTKHHGNYFSLQGNIEIGISWNYCSNRDQLAWTKGMGGLYGIVLGVPDS